MFKARRRLGKPTILLLTAIILGVAATSAMAANLIGGNNDNTIVGTSGNDNILDGNGNDHIWGLGGSDSINIGFGNDVIDAGGSCPPGNPPQGSISPGHPDNYCMHGPKPPCGSTNISIAGGGQNGGDDTVYGNCGKNNILFGKGMGNDKVLGYGGPNNINVSNGNDTIDLRVASAGSNVTTGTGTDVVFAQNGFVDTINCGSKHTTVYADRTDRTSNCTVKFSAPAVAAQRSLRTHRVKHHAKKHAKKHATGKR